jgi:hypothetical protein
MLIALVVVSHLACFICCCVCLQIVEMKKKFQEGGRSVYTWEKQPNDKYVTAFGAGLLTFGMLQLFRGQYRLATGTGKLE